MSTRLRLLCNFYNDAFGLDKPSPWINALVEVGRGATTTFYPEDYEPIWIKNAPVRNIGALRELAGRLEYSLSSGRQRMERRMSSAAMRYTERASSELNLRLKREIEGAPSKISWPSTDTKIELECHIKIVRYRKGKLLLCP